MKSIVYLAIGIIISIIVTVLAFFIGNKFGIKGIDLFFITCFVLFLLLLVMFFVFWTIKFIKSFKAR